MPPLENSIISRKRLAGLFGRGGAQADAVGADSVCRSNVAEEGQTSSAPTGPVYWRSLNELAQTPEFDDMLQREFSELATEVIEPSTRRDFLRLMGASLALAGIGLTSCRWPEEKIAPFARKQDGYVMGVPVQFATAMDIAGFATGLLVTSYDGRPIKIEGNPLHSASLGAASMWHQASVLDLYDANRSKEPLRRDKPGGTPNAASMTEVTATLQPLFAGLRQQRGSRCAILAEAHSSPSRARLQQELAHAMPLLQWYEYEPLGWDNQREGTRLAFNVPLRPQYKLDQAQFIVSFDCDFLTPQHPDSLHLARDWAAGRRADGGRMNRTYVIEANFSITGANADHRLLVKPSEVEAAIYALAAELNTSHNLGLPSGALSAPPLSFASDPGTGKAWRALVDDLAQSNGTAVILAGPQLSPGAHALAAALNHGLGSVGTTVEYIAEDQPQRQSHNAGIGELARALGTGAVDTLLILGGNPAYDAPADLDFGRMLSQIRSTLHLSLHDNETSQLCRWHVHRTHYLEEWGDARGYDGSYSVIQPLIDPLYGGVTPLELLQLLLDGTLRKPYDIARDTFKGIAGSDDFEQRWEATLHDGVLKDSAPATYAIPAAGLTSLPAPPPANNGELELLLVPDYSVFDGRFANNGWLQEVADPMTKLTWDNACVIGVGEAERRGLKHEDVVELEANGVKLKLPIYVIPGIADGVAVAQLGYGRTAAGDIGDKVGSNAYLLRTQAAPTWLNATLHRAADIHYFAEVQDHFVIDRRGFEERGKRTSVLVREANLDFYQQHPDFARHMQEESGEISRWTDWKYAPVKQGSQRPTHRWGMGIDLAACTGCSACIVACTAENNIPVVGKLRVRQGREMQWLRVDRYFRSDPANPLAAPANPRVALMPVTCHHCEMAPCEQVCPVNATTHSDEGLNDMVYNRCIGTRYCSNNCPFKVRRFNFFNYQKSLTETQKLVHNPQVTIRSRGVMEKCTYCVQRIQNTKINANNEGRELKDGEIKTACQQTCPTEAITFGDLNNDTSRVYEQRLGVHNDRAYTLLDELQVRPRTNYRAGLWNPAPGTDEYAAPAPVLFESEAGGEGEPQTQLGPGPAPLKQPRQEVPDGATE